MPKPSIFFNIRVWWAANGDLNLTLADRFECSWLVLKNSRKFPKVFILVGLEKFAKVCESFRYVFVERNSKISFWFTLHADLGGQIRPGASDRTQSDNIWLDRVGVWSCILCHMLHLTAHGLETAPDRDHVEDRASVLRPLLFANYRMNAKIYYFSIRLHVH